MGSGDLEERQEFINIDEEEADDFNQLVFYLIYEHGFILVSDVSLVEC